MEEKKNENKIEQDVVSKKVYIPPSLTLYGKLTDLTGGGPTSKPEPHSGSIPSPLDQMS
jgi:hypothetical protein